MVQATSATVKAIINGIEVEVPKGTSILDAASTINLKIPALCKHSDLPATASCGICVVKIKNNNKMLRACCTELQEGMDIITHDPEIVETRKTVLELILSNHPNECLTCARNQNCELQTMAQEFGIRQEYFGKDMPVCHKDETTQAITLEACKCIKCGRCVTVCQQVQDVWALSFVNRGFETQIAPAAEFSLNESPCVKCGQCSAHCPVGAIYEYDETQKVWDALQDPDKHCVVQFAPAVRVAIGEYFGLESGDLATGKLYTLLRRIGFDAVFDTNFAADLTIMEEGTEFVKRFTKGEGEIPLITSCCPAWVDFMEKYHTDVIPHFSTCKSPQSMLGALAKTYYAEKQGIDPSKIVVISIMPCTAKKFEIHRSKDMYSSGYQDVDISLTTRELNRMIKQAGIDFAGLPEEEPDHILADYTGGGTIFGATGGVMEAAVRSVHYLVTGKNMDNVDLQPVRGLEGVKEAKLDVGGNEVRVAVAHGLSNVETVLNKIRESKEKGGEPAYHFVEVMACPGGCIAGGGQPLNITDAIREKRSAGLYTDDKECKFRNSHENPMIQKLYEEYLGEPCGKKSHEILHLHYQPREQYKDMYRQVEYSDEH